MHMQTCLKIDKQINFKKREFTKETKQFRLQNNQVMYIFFRPLPSFKTISLSTSQLNEDEINVPFVYWIHTNFNSMCFIICKFLRTITGLKARHVHCLIYHDVNSYDFIQ